ncbi:uncharacterized protein LOC119607781 [Lucilia sericata]|uniref:uncharacterized protein LOC119607781 n=1 Tax=Lucilia sericata TaxID=13632 RepID=UPI0018A7FED6|nr:uncharacterized protein LOC119607781 [Lucilia sericata]
MNLEDLPQYLLDNCHYNMNVFDRKKSMKDNHYIIAFMDFSGGKCSLRHLKWIDQIYQVASNLSSHGKYFIADYQDIDVINPEWKPQDFKQNKKPTIIGIDRKKNKFLMKDFKTTASLFYFVYDLYSGDLYFTEPWPNIYDGKLVKTCIADSLNLCISSIKKNIFLAIYYSNTESSEQFLQLLEEVAGDVKMFSLKMIKIDARLNYIPLEMDDKEYPILYFIPKKHKNRRIRLRSNNLKKAGIVDFITVNIQKAETDKLKK